MRKIKKNLGKNLIKKMVRVILPVPVLNDVIAEVVNRNKLVFLGLLIAVFLIPVMLLSALFSSGFNVQSSATQQRVAEAQRQAYFNYYCRENKDKCEVRDEFKGQSIDCQKSPEKCRKIRDKIDCSKMPERCEGIENGKINCKDNPDKCRPKDGENEKYYKEQEEQEFSRIFRANPNMVSDKIAGSPAPALGIVKMPIELKNYVQSGFVDTGTPHLSPLGGQGFTRSQITCPYMCKAKGYDYPLNIEHWGFDIVPNASYFKQTRASQLYDSKVVVFATCSGKSYSFWGEAGGNTVNIVCRDTELIVSMAHLSEVFIPSGAFGGSMVDLVAGQPIGVMGNTGGSSFGAHVHYQINKKGCLSYNSSCTIDPEPYMNKSAGSG